MKQANNNNTREIKDVDIVLFKELKKQEVEMGVEEGILLYLEEEVKKAIQNYGDGGIWWERFASRTKLF